MSIARGLAQAVAGPLANGLSGLGSGQNPNIVSNSDFANGTTGWTAQQSGVINVVAGELVLAAGGGSTISGFSQAITCEVGKTYRASCYARRGPGTTQEVQIKVSALANLNSAPLTVGTTQTTQTLLTGTFVATATTMYVGGRLAGSGDGNTGIYDNFSVRAE